MIVRTTAVLAALLWLVPATTAADPVGSGVEPGGDQRPNVLLCIADDWGWPHAGAYGDPAARTPSFDRVAREGVVFEHAFVSSPSCTPSRNALLSGQHFWRLGDGANLHSTLRAGLGVFPLLLEDAGYHVGHWRKSFGPGRLGPGWEGRHPAGKRYRGLEPFLDARPEGAPFCFWLGASDPHRPYERGTGRAAGIDPDAVDVPGFLPDAPEVRDDLADYLFEVARFDADVGAALALLAERGDLEDTIVVVTGDHGMPFPRCKANLYDMGVRVPLAVRWGARVPAGRRVTDFVSLVDLAPTFLEAAGLAVPAEMNGRSLLATLVSDGAGRVEASRDEVVFGRERHTPAQRSPSFDGYPARGIRTDGWLYVRNVHPERWPAGVSADSTRGRDWSDCDDGPTKAWILAHRGEPKGRRAHALAFARRPAEELYDVTADPDQVENLAADPQHAAVRAALAARLQRELEATGDPRAREPRDDEVPLDHGPYLGGFAGGARRGERPNVLLILADDQGFSDLGCYGGEIPTPNLDGLAARGLRFTQVYNTSKCFPSRACLLTGAYAQDVGMDRRPGAIRNAVTLAEILRAAGYRTLMVGKHHGTENPVERGFDRYFGLRDGAMNYFNPGAQRPGEPAPAQKRPDRAWCIDEETLRPYTPPAGFYATDAFTDRALAFLEEYRGERRPFFLYASFTAPHDPLMAPEEDVARHAGRYDAGWRAVRAARWERQLELGLFGADVALSDDELGDWGALDDAARREEVRRMEVYAAMVDRLDRNVGRLLAKLEELGELERTLVLFASDNGGSAEVVRIGTGEIGSMTRWSSVGKRWANVSNTPFRRYKNHSHEGGICTPFIVSGAGVTGEPGTFVRAPVHFVDLMPTLVELAGARYPTEHRGEPVVAARGASLVPLLRGERLERGRPLFWKWSKGRAVRDGRWKLVSFGGEWELYDLEADRTETRDLARELPDEVARLAASWEAWDRETGR